MSFQQFHAPVLTNYQVARGTFLIRLHAPTLDDVFLAKTGRSLEGAASDAERADGAEPSEAPAQ